MVDVALLSHSKHFAGLSKRELEQVADIAVLEKQPAGHQVIEENETASDLYLVSEGRVAVKMRSRTGQEVVIDELGPGSLFGWSAVLDDQTFTAAVSTVEPSMLVAIDGPRLRQLFQEYPAIASHLVTSIAIVISSRLAHLRSKLADEPFAPEWLMSPTQAGPLGGPCLSPTSDMRKMACPACATVNGPFGVVNETAQYRCRSCGMVFYAPACCETPETESDKAKGGVA
ncbi:MAG: cyclic nucleotide-binding domain-containing protein [bacterium]